MVLDRITPPKVRPIATFDIPFPEERVLRNGMPLRIIEAGTEEVVRLDVVVRGGRMSVLQPFVALLANRMLREGSLHYAPSAIAEKLDYYGASVELSVSLKHEYVTLYALNKYFPQSLAIVADFLRHPTFPERELRTVIETNKQYFRIMEEKVSTISQKNINRMLFGDRHPLGYNAELEDFDRIDVDLLKDYYQKHYHSDNCTLYVSGRVTPQIVSCIEEYVGNESWGERSLKFVAPAYPIETARGKHCFIERKEAVQSALKMGFLTIPCRHSDYAKFRVLVVLLGGYFGSRLMKNIREKKGYTYGIEAILSPVSDESVFLISTEAANEHVPAILREVGREIDRLCEMNVGQKELEIVKNYMLGDFSRSFEGPFSSTDAWIYVETNGLDVDYYRRMIEEIHSVDRYDILRLAQTYLCKENLIEVVAGEKL